MKRLKAYGIIVSSYALACAVFLLVFNFAAEQDGRFRTILLALFAADISATIVIWIFGVIFKNSSFYDPYWSFFPWFILLFLMNYLKAWNSANILLLAALSLWSWRLTINWAYTCEDLTTQDWRYTQFRRNYGKLWQFINFFGINLMPTVLVFLALIPALFLAACNASISVGTACGALIILAGTALEFFADQQMHRHKKNAESGTVLQTGLWKYSRHPNYLGEILIWFGVYLALALSFTQYRRLFFGVLLMAALFIFISIPMMEKRQLEQKTAYREYRKKTSMLLLLPQKKNAENKNDE